MLTPAQQKVKKELEELQVNAYFHHDTPPYPPTPPYPSKKKWVYLTIGIFSLILVSSLTLFSILTPNHTKIVSYLAKEQQYSRESEKLLNDSMETNFGNIQLARSEQAQLVVRMTALPVPSSLKHHKQDFLSVMEQQQDILSYLTLSKNPNPDKVNKKLIELHVKQELATDSLLTALDKEDIRYGIDATGAVQYWVHSKAYHY